MPAMILQFIKRLVQWILKFLTFKTENTSPSQKELIKSGIEGYCIRIFYYGVYNPAVRHSVSVSHEAFTILDDHYCFIKEVYPNEKGYFRVRLKPGTYFIVTLRQEFMEDILKRQIPPHQTVKVQAREFAWVTIKTEICGC